MAEVKRIMEDEIVKRYLGEKKMDSYTEELVKIALKKESLFFEIEDSEFIEEHKPLTFQITAILQQKLPENTKIIACSLIDLSQFYRNKICCAVTIS